MINLSISPRSIPTGQFGRNAELTLPAAGSQPADQIMKIPARAMVSRAKQSVLFTFLLLPPLYGAEPLQFYSGDMNSAVESSASEMQQGSLGFIPHGYSPYNEPVQPGRGMMPPQVPQYRPYPPQQNGYPQPVMPGMPGMGYGQFSPLPDPWSAFQPFGNFPSW